MYYSVFRYALYSTGVRVEFKKYSDGNDAVIITHLTIIQNYNTGMEKNVLHINFYLDRKMYMVK